MATLTVSISESVTLNGKERGSVNTTDITGVTLVNDRIVSVGTAEQSLLLFKNVKSPMEPLKPIAK